MAAAAATRHIRASGKTLRWACIREATGVDYATAVIAVVLGRVATCWEWRAMRPDPGLEADTSGSGHQVPRRGTRPRAGEQARWAVDHGGLTSVAQARRVKVEGNLAENPPLTALTPLNFGKASIQQHSVLTSQLQDLFLLRQQQASMLPPCGAASVPGNRNDTCCVTLQASRACSSRPPRAQSYSRPSCQGQRCNLLRWVRGIVARD